MRTTSVRPPAARLRPSRLLLLAALAGAGGCDLLSPEPKVSALRAAEGDAQSDTVLATLRTPVVVEAVETGGDGVKGKEIRFRAGNGGTVTPDRAKTDGDGRVRVTWKLGSGAGSQTLTAMLGSDTTITVTFTATAQAGSLAALEVAEGNGQTGTAGRDLPQPVVFRARDAHGNGKPGVALSLAVARGGGSLGPSTGATGSDGRLGITWKLGSQSLDQWVTATADRFSAEALANVDSTRAIVFVNLPGSAAVGDTVDAVVRVNLNGLTGERRGMLAATFTYPAGTLTPAIIRLRDAREVWTSASATAPAGSSAITLAVTRPRNDLLAETAFTLRFVVRASPPSGSDLPLALAVRPGGLVSVEAFNDLSGSVSVVGDVIRIR
ncbi:MAG TPA: hypothetical protein VHG28_10980 [Longimicrobiaceae bacterium]|nr:hypothetical protein [Longimicrobiaceae bacterium]